MKYNFLLFLTLFSGQLFAQHFSGEIVYQNTIVPKNDNVNIDSIIESKKGMIAKYLITDKYYKSTYFKKGKPTYSYTYHNDSKRMYDEYSESNYITYRDSRKSNYKYYDSKVYRDSTTTILGRECFMVAYKSEYGNSKTYYSDDIKVNYNAFIDHKVGNWYNKLKEVNGCITLKTITEFPDFYEIQEAIEINSKTLRADEFDLPKSKIAVASYSALDKQAEIKEPSKNQIECYRNKLQIGVNLIEKSQKITSYVSFILTKEGKIENIKPYEKDELGLYKIAMEIIQGCGFEFTPGEINGEYTDSEVYFPVEFK